MKCTVFSFFAESRVRDKSVSRIVDNETDVFENEADATVFCEVEAKFPTRACFTHLRQLN